ncbi:voltage-gated hydrogen channel 1-like [Uloborus diversus]|uniref:voltage-gated hydrogen channel 1-like n=1 Tax=Uloborus diversus TaxID=327109 RepID=UPI002409D24F|nr:voltage-gated hydrogen channel 1-like [Uloborus diversus]
MEQLNNVSKSIEHLNLKDDGSSSVLSDTDEDPSIRPLITFRERLCKLFDSHKFQIAVVALVIIDCLIVITELILEAKHDELHNRMSMHVLHYMSIAILSLFVVEILLKIYAFRTEFFRHKLEVFDAFVVFLSFALDIAVQEEQLMSNGIDLVIILRLWRVTRILNGVVMSVKAQSEHKLLKERQLKEGLEQELSKCRLYTNALEQEVETLRLLLRKHGIGLPPSVISDKETHQTTISVVAEVNQIEPK